MLEPAELIEPRAESFFSGDTTWTGLAEIELAEVEDGKFRVSVNLCNASLRAAPNRRISSIRSATWKSLKTFNNA